MVKGIVADIQRSSIHDGPGIRTTVFLKGCPLKCAWCHNPECIDFRPQQLFYSDKCIGCGQCDKGCFSGARVICGKEMTVEEVLKEVLLDKDYYGTNGGITISGGEPMAQKAFVSELLDACKASGIHCAMETSLIYFDSEIFGKLDLCMADLKIWNENTHLQYTGVSNGRIKDNFCRLNDMQVPIIARTPVITEIDQGIPKISSFLHSLNSVIQYELLPYHPLGNGKRKALGLEADSFSVPPKELMESLAKYQFQR